MEDSVLCLFKSGFLLPPGIPEAVQEWRRVSGWAVWLSFEAETQKTCDVEDAIFFAHTTSGKVQNIGAIAA